MACKALRPHFLIGLFLTLISFRGGGHRSWRGGGSLHALGPWYSSEHGSFEAPGPPNPAPALRHGSVHTQLEFALG
jgi:hypothetical protein